MRKFTGFFLVLVLASFFLMAACASSESDDDDATATDDDSVPGDDDSQGADDDSAGDDSADDDFDDSDDDTAADDASDDDTEPPEEAGLMLVYATDQGDPHVLTYTSFRAREPFTQWVEAPLPALDFTALFDLAESIDCEAHFTLSQRDAAKNGDIFFTVNPFVESSSMYYVHSFTAGSVLLRYSVADGAWVVALRATLPENGPAQYLPLLLRLYDFNADRIGALASGFYAEGEFPFFNMSIMTAFLGLDPADWGVTVLWNDPIFMDNITSDSVRDGRLVLLVDTGTQKRLKIWDGQTWSEEIPAYPANSYFGPFWTMGPGEEWYMGDFGFGDGKPLMHRVGDDFQVSALSLPCALITEWRPAPDVPLILHRGIGYSYLDESSGAWKCVTMPGMPLQPLYRIEAVRDRNLFYFSTCSDAPSVCRLHQSKNGQVAEVALPAGYEGNLPDKVFLAPGN